jgi:uncharacterized protein YqhQ
VLLHLVGVRASFLITGALLPIVTIPLWRRLRRLDGDQVEFAAKQRGSALATITAPGLWLQRVTTQPPSDTQTAVAICALDRAMWLEAKQGGELIIA